MQWSARPSQLRVAALQWYVAVRRSDSPLGNQRPVPAGVHIELLHIDEQPCLDLVVAPTADINAVRGQQPGEVSGKRPLEALVEPLGPERILDVFDFVGAIADHQGISQKI